MAPAALDRPPTAYDLVEYPARPRATTHPDHLATIARLFGLETAEASHARVLEVGCSDGGNLVSMALSLPESRFLGVDAALSAIEEGTRVVRELGLSNLELRCADLLDADATGFGTFDYVIAHGVYSWVPEAVREKLLAVCKASLAPLGVAFISYNTYPGCYPRRMIREMMLFHVRGVSDPEERIRAALEFLAHVSQLQPEGSPSRAALDHELKQLAGAGTSFVYHDAIAPENVPFYFEEFAADAARHGLAFLSEAQFFESFEAARRSGLARSIPEGAYADIVRAEQYLDFLKARSFRQTLLVHDGVTVDRRLDPRRVQRLFACGRLVRTQPEAAGDEGAEVEFQGPKGRRARTSDPVAKRAFDVLNDAWPAALAFPELLRRTVDRSDLSRSADEIATALGSALIDGYASNVLELRASPWPFTTSPGERPLVSPLVRLQARSDGLLTNLRHETVSFDVPLGRKLLGLMDGTRTRGDLIEVLERDSAANRSAGAPPPGELALAQLERMIAELAKLAVFVA